MQSLKKIHAWAQMKVPLSLLTLTLGQGQTRNVAQYTLHHMAYAPAKLEAAMSNGLIGNAFTRSIALYIM